jgi:anti-anti-sigma factor
VPDSPDLDTKRKHADPAFFTCTTSSTGQDAIWLHAAGELDLATCPRLERVLEEVQKHARLVVLDLREVTFISTAGVRTICEASAYGRLAGHRLIVVNAPPAVQAVFDITRMAGEIESHRLRVVGVTGPPAARVTMT